MALMMRVKPETAEWLLENNELMFSEQLLCTLLRWQQYICGEPVDGISIEDGADTSHDLLNLSNDSMSTRGKALTDRAKSLDIQLYM